MITLPDGSDIVFGVDSKDYRAGERRDEILIKPDAEANKLHWAREREIGGKPAYCLGLRFDPTQEYSVVLVQTIHRVSKGKLAERTVAKLPLCDAGKSPCVITCRHFTKPEVIDALRKGLFAAVAEQDWDAWTQYINEREEKRHITPDKKRGDK